MAEDDNPEYYGLWDRDLPDLFWFLAGLMRPPAIDFIARADYGYLAEEAAENLRIISRDGDVARIRRGNVGEVLELTRYEEGGPFEGAPSPDEWMKRSARAFSTLLLTMCPGVLEQDDSLVRLATSLFALDYAGRPEVQSFLRTLETVERDHGPSLAAIICIQFWLGLERSGLGDEATTLSQLLSLDARLSEDLSCKAIGVKGSSWALLLDRAPQSRAEYYTIGHRFAHWARRANDPVLAGMLEIIGSELRSL